MNQRSSSLRRLVPLFACVAALSACGGGGDGGDGGGDPPTSEPAPSPAAPTPSPPPPPPAPAPAETPPLSEATTLTTTAMGEVHWSNGSTADGGQGQDVGGLGCSPAPLDWLYHRHTHLTIMLDGQMLQVPANVGIEASCLYGLHTHDGSGTIHVEPDAEGVTPTLGLFFDIWGQPLEADDVAGVKGKPVVVYVKDGDELSIHDGDPRDIELTSQREITIQLGDPPEEIPTFTWTFE